MIEDIMSSSVESIDQEIYKKTHRLHCKIDLREFANNFNSYLNTRRKAKLIEVLQLADFRKFVSEHKYEITLPEKRGILQVRVCNESDFTVLLLII